MQRSSPTPQTSNTTELDQHQDRETNHSVRLHYLGLSIICIVGLLVSIQLFVQSKALEQERIHSHFLQSAKERSFTLQQGINASLSEIESLAAFYAASNWVSRDEFHAFVQPFLAHNPTIQALEWIPYIAHGDRQKHELAAQQEGLKNYQITQRHQQGKMIRALDRSEYFPVYYIEPMIGNETAIGFDLASNQTRLATLNLSRKNRTMLATSRITLVQEKEQEMQQGFLVFLPVYKKIKAKDTLQGFALGVFRIGDILNEAMKNSDIDNINVRLFDDSAPLEKHVLAQYPANNTTAAENNSASSKAKFQYNQTFNVAGRQWRVVFSPKAEFLSDQYSWQPWFVLIIGLLLTLILGGYLFLNLKRLRQNNNYTKKILRTKNKLQNEIEDRLSAEQKVLKSKDKLEKAHEKLKSQQQQLIHSEKLASVGQLAAGVAHEINNPTSFVRGNLEVLKEYKDQIKKLLSAYSVLEKKIHEGDTLSLDSVINNINDIKNESDMSYILSDMDSLLDESIDGTQRIQKIVEDLKCFSRVDDSQKIDCNINDDVIEISIRLVWNELKYKCSLNKNLTTLPNFYCHPGQLSQVIMNLLINACDAIKGRGEINISSEALESHIEIKVSDSGCGIEEADMLKLFDPFFTTKGIGKGTGLGLSISHGIIKKHGGLLTVSSTLGVGTCFTILLPLNPQN